MKIRVKVVYRSGDMKLISFNSEAEARYFIDEVSKEALEAKVLNFYA